MITINPKQWQAFCQLQSKDSFSELESLEASSLMRTNSEEFSEYCFKRLGNSLKQNTHTNKSQVPVVHVYNPSYLEG
jgi:hypothetical protein